MSHRTIDRAFEKPQQQAALRELVKQLDTMDTNTSAVKAKIVPFIIFNNSRNDDTSCEACTGTPAQSTWTTIFTVHLKIPAKAKTIKMLARFKCTQGSDYYIRISDGTNVSESSLDYTDINFHESELILKRIKTDSTHLYLQIYPIDAAVDGATECVAAWFMIWVAEFE